ncbi:MAG: signal recognition particle-docking protein FtsY, partial [Cyanobium sp.]
MVFDWFKRAAAPTAASGSEPAEVPPAEAGQPPVGADQALPSPPTSDQSTVPAGPSTPAGPSPGIDADALAWAREAYARLKAQQEAASPAAAPPAAVVVEPQAPALVEPIPPAASA